MPNTQQKIVEAAILVFHEDYSAPLERVAERAAVTRWTLHRYFTGRDELLASCEQEMRRSCRHAMKVSLDSSDNPLIQLEHLLYGCIDCGAKYSFLGKLHSRSEHHHDAHHAECAEYDALDRRFRAVIEKLQAQGMISSHLTSEWVTMLFNGVVLATVNSPVSPATLGELKQFAWFSFSRGIGR